MSENDGADRLSEKIDLDPHRTQKQAGHHLVDGAPLEEREIKVVYRTSAFVFMVHVNFNSDFTNGLDFRGKGRRLEARIPFILRTCVYLLRTYVVAVSKVAVSYYWGKGGAKKRKAGHEAPASTLSGADWSVASKERPDNSTGLVGWDCRE
jgi:hypothetical protein